MEGVVQYSCSWTRAAVPYDTVAMELCHQRAALFARDAIGCRPERGYGACYGNLSARTGAFAAAPGRREFLVSGTQTGGIANAGAETLTRVLAYDHAKNHVIAQGPCAPSSETLTHGAIYDASLAIRAVVHGHDPALWAFVLQNAGPQTPAGVSYGTPEMAAAAKRVVREAQRSGWRFPGVLAMAGHRDGVVAWGASPKQATQRFLAAWEAARSTNRGPEQRP